MTLDQRDQTHLHGILTWLIDGAGRQRCPDDVYTSAHVLRDLLANERDTLTMFRKSLIKPTCQPKEASQTPDPFDGRTEWMMAL